MHLWSTMRVCGRVPYLHSLLKHALHKDGQRAAGAGEHLLHDHGLLLDRCQQALVLLRQVPQRDAGCCGRIHVTLPAVAAPADSSRTSMNIGRVEMYL